MAVDYGGGSGPGSHKADQTFVVCSKMAMLNRCNEGKPNRVFTDGGVVKGKEKKRAVLIRDMASCKKMII